MESLKSGLLWASSSWVLEIWYPCNLLLAKRSTCAPELYKIVYSASSLLSINGVQYNFTDSITSLPRVGDWVPASTFFGNRTSFPFSITIPRPSVYIFEQLCVCCKLVGSSSTTFVVEAAPTQNIGRFLKSRASMILFTQ